MAAFELGNTILRKAGEPLSSEIRFSPHKPDPWLPKASTLSLNAFTFYSVVWSNLLVKVITAAEIVELLHKVSFIELLFTPPILVIVPINTGPFPKF